jgi:tungstate transport system substrate-binding protein
MKRRLLLLASLASPLVPDLARAQRRESLRNPLRLGVDHALAESGLAGSLQRAFGRDTGIAVQLVPGPALQLLGALERGEIDATLTNTPAAEVKLSDQGLAHDRRGIANASFVIVGPAPGGKAGDPAGIAGGRDAAQALQQIQAAALAAPPGALQFVSAGDGSGAHVIEQSLWRAARLAPAAPWYVSAEMNKPLIAQARELSAYAVVERGSWAAQGGKPLALLVEGDPLLAVAVHYMRSFHLNHPAGKIFANWIAGRKGRRVVASQHGYIAPRR